MPTAANASNASDLFSAGPMFASAENPTPENASYAARREIPKVLPSVETQGGPWWNRRL